MSDNDVNDGKPVTDLGTENQGAGIFIETPVENNDARLLAEALGAELHDPNVEKTNSDDEEIEFCLDESDACEVRAIPVLVQHYKQSFSNAATIYGLHAIANAAKLTLTFMDSSRKLTVAWLQHPVRNTFKPFAGAFIAVSCAQGTYSSFEDLSEGKVPLGDFRQVIYGVPETLMVNVAKDFGCNARVIWDALVEGWNFDLLLKPQKALPPIKEEFFLPMPIPVPIEPPRPKVALNFD